MTIDKDMLIKAINSLDMEELEARLNALSTLAWEMVPKDEDHPLNKAILGLLNSHALNWYVTRKGGGEREVFAVLSGLLVGLITPVNLLPVCERCLTNEATVANLCPSCAAWVEAQS